MDLDPADDDRGVSPYLNINLLISSSRQETASGSYTLITPVGSVYIEGITIPTVGYNGVDLSSTLAGLEYIKFDMEVISGSISLDIPILSRKSKTTYYYFKLEKTYIGEAPDCLPSAYYDVAADTFDPKVIRVYYYDGGSEMIFIPYLPYLFTSHDYNPLINNSEESRRSVVLRQLDKNGNQAIPTNMMAVRAGTATFAEVEDSAYSRVGNVTSKYEGSKLTNRGFLDFDPTMTVRSFLGSVHPLNSDLATLLTTTNIPTTYYYFNVCRPPKNLIPPSASLGSAHPLDLDNYYPSLSGSLTIVSASYTSNCLDNNTVYTISGSLLYEKIKENYARLTNVKVLAAERGEVYTTDGLGYVYEISSSLDV